MLIGRLINNLCIYVIKKSVQFYSRDSEGCHTTGKHGMEQDGTGV